METFKGISRAVSGSNGLIQDLLEAWILVGALLDSVDDTSEVLAFLRNRLTLGDGGRAWNVAPSNSELKRFADWRIFAQILAECAAQISLEQSEILVNLNRTNCLSPTNQDRDHSIFLIAWNLDFLELVNESLAATGFASVGRKELHLTAKEEHEVQLNILFAHKRDVKQRSANEEQALILDQIIQLLQTELPDKRRQLSDCLQERGEWLQSCGQSVHAVSAYRQAIQVEPDSELKDALIEFVEEITSTNSSYSSDSKQ